MALEIAEFLSDTSVDIALSRSLIVAKFTSTVPVIAALIASVKSEGVTVAYVRVFQFDHPSPTLTFCVSVSKPNSPIANVGLFVDQFVLVSCLS